METWICLILNLFQLVKFEKLWKKLTTESLQVQTICISLRGGGRYYEPITHIVNLSLPSNSIPKIWKAAYVIPLLKGGYPSEKKNYDFQMLFGLYFYEKLGWGHSNKKYTSAWSSFEFTISDWHSWMYTVMYTEWSISLNYHDSTVPDISVCLQQNTRSISSISVQFSSQSASPFSCSSISLKKKKGNFIRMTLLVLIGR